MGAFKIARTFRIGLMLCLALATPAKAEDFCPDFTTDACLQSIRQNIQRLDYDTARDDAELQCYEKPEGGPHVELSEPVLLAQASGCYYLYALEKFLDNTLKAVEAEERTREIASWSCNHGFDSLCEVSLGLLRLHLAALMRELRGDLKKEPPNKLFAGAALRQVNGGRVLPKTFMGGLTKDLKAAFAAEGIILNDCENCRLAVKNQAAMTKDSAKKVLDVELSLKGSELVLRLRLFDLEQARLIWEKTYETHDLTERQRLFGFNASVPAVVAEARRINAYEPNYKFLVGLGVARIPNTSGRGADSSRGVIQVRALERFHSGHSEFGMMLSLHATQRNLDKRTGRAKSQSNDEDTGSASADAPADDTGPEDKETKTADDVSPYPTSLNVAFVYDRMFFSGRENYDEIRHGISLAAGGLLTNSILSATGRLGWDLYLGRRFVLSPGFIYVGRSTVEVDKKFVLTKPTSGGELVLSLNL